MKKLSVTKKNAKKFPKSQNVKKPPVRFELLQDQGKVKFSQAQECMSKVY